MKIIINNQEQLTEAYLAYKIKLAAKVQKLIIAIAQSAESDGEDHTDVAIEASLLPASYSLVPAMLARNIAPNINYLYVQCKMIDGAVVVHMSNVKHPSTFRARVLEALLERKRFIVNLSMVPKTYRERPKLLARAIQRDVPGKIATIAKSNKIIWKVRKSTEED